ncbi:HYR domain-containing protein [Cryomorpha ignava]|uniref:HYR domain-containing protein n=1 Tax=Cryomorpha ignava TaxID=101383 RepID=A0A7K3WQ62_9FLAO|nr:HYR domain-containing protein [Cryomorpha ignava]NEN23161.1 HYR domain-containing protein [Cryomorpha ignava]
MKKSTPAFLLHKHILILFGFFLYFGTLHAQVSIICPTDIVQNNDPLECGAIVNYTPPTGTGSGTNITTTRIAGPASGSFFDVGTTEIIFEVTNDEGAQNQCAFYITVNDTENPVFQCPADFSVNANATTCSVVVTFALPVATDNCGIFAIYQFAGLPSGSSFTVGEHFLDFTAFDLEGNQAFCRVILTVLDVSDPIITCPADITVSASASCDAVVNYTAPVGTDGCSSVNTALTAGIGSGGSFPLGTTIESYTVTDAYGNTASCSFNVNVVDNTPPVINCPPNITINIGATGCSEIATYDMPTATDNCGPITITQTQGLPSGSTFPSGYNVQKFTATDAAGNTAICQFTIFIQETVPPVISCPADIVVSNDPGECGAVVNYPAVVSSDNCLDANTDLIGGLASGSNFPLGATLITYEVRDNSDNAASCSFTVTVLDTEAPVFECLDIIVLAAPGTCDAEVLFSAPTVSDNCLLDNIVQTGGPISGSTFTLGSTPIEYTATDDAGNVQICTFNIIVTDDEAPEITCPADISFTIPGDACTTLLTYPDPVITDNCSVAGFTVISGPQSGDVVDAGIYTVEFEATDGSGNTATCSFNITIAETEDPIFVDCPGDLVFSSDAESVCEGIAIFDTPTASDCSDVTVAQTGGLPSGDVFPGGINPVEFTATDLFGNTAVCTFNIIIQQADPIAITCPENIIIAADAGTCEAVVIYDDPETNDSCNIATTTQTAGLPSGSLFPEGETTVAYEITDLAGNTATCSFTITIVDEEAPEITCPADISFTISNDECTTLLTYADPVMTDNCAVGGYTLISGPASGDVVNAGIYTVEFEGTDLAGNTASCSFEITIAETENPVFVDCPGDLVFPTDPGIACTGIAIFDTPTASDCSDVVVTQTGGLPSGDVFPAGTNPVEFTATDQFGNTAVCTFNIILQPSDPIAITCTDDIVTPADAGTCEALVNYDAPTTNDSCNIATVTQTAGLPSGAVFPEGETTITYEITDLAGNSATCSFTVTVVDEEAPEVTCPADILVNIPDGDCAAVVAYGVPVATDNCALSDLSLTAGLASGESFPAGINTVTFTATDAAGNTTSCSFTVSIIEAVPPTITCPVDIIIDNDPGICGAVVDYTAPEGDDNCGGAATALTAGLAPGSEFPVGITVVTYTVTDLSGNQTSCSFNVTVNDTELPVFDCPENVAVNSAPDICGAVYNFALPEATDNCTDILIVSQTGGPTTGSTLALGETAFEFTTQDDAGNTATCSYTVTVVDATAPVFTNCPTDSTLYLAPGSCTVVADYGNPLASDNCNVTVSQTAGPSNGASLNPGSYAYEITATDNAGNSTLCTFTFTVLDTIAPVIICPADFETCDLVPEFDLPTATDNCEIAAIVQIGGPAAGATFPEGENTLTFVAADVNGNTDTCSFKIMVLENAPTANAGADETLCDETFTTLTGNDPEGAAAEWTLVEGSGIIDSPNSAQTAVSGLGAGTNQFVYALDPETGCDVKTDTVTIFVEIGVSVIASADKLIMFGSSTTLSASPSPEGGTYNWSPPVGLSCTDCDRPVAMPGETTPYYVTYTSVMGCQATDSVLIRVFKELPNTITPDGDGANDVWNIPEIEKYPDAHVVIYNRWGNSVYESTGYRDPWDGTNDGKDLPTGSYYYILDFKTAGMDNLNGTVNIIR